eukprot:CAMPEP_0118940784 /NCGR_PEP_ID=MMETSP1169-20130426/32298_1 /TAXON_ID=36882 /ORGANISM="Pyramimonas obovata, Strain CCMP722" /LENGTH=62 /DNA_ID=CAMNT_0006885369 /DNA_START=385 /DNA_END=569 /DNA_ORIENTATION=+
MGLDPLRWLMDERTPSSATATHAAVADPPADSPPTSGQAAARMAGRSSLATPRAGSGLTSAT